MSSQADIERVRSRYPAPIAAAFWQVTRIRDTGPEVFQKHLRLIDLFESILKYTFAIMLSYYRQEMSVADNVEQELKNIQRPSLGQWRGLQRTLAKFYQPREEAHSLIQTLSRSLTSPGQAVNVSSKKAAALISSCKDLSVYDWMVCYRNWLLKKEGRYLSQGDREKHVPILQNLLTDILLDLDCLARFPLVYVKEIVRQADQNERMQIMNCMGTSQNWSSSTVLTHRELSPRHCYVCELTDNDQLRPAIDLHPFIICTTCNSDGHEQVFSISEGGEKDTEYISYDCGHSISPKANAEFDPKRDMQRLLNSSQWEAYVVERVVRKQGTYLQFYLNTLKQKENQRDYAEHYRQVEEELRKAETFDLRQSVIRRIFEQYGIQPPVEVQLSIEAFAAQLTSIEQGEQTVLEWRTLGAEKVVIEPDIGEVEAEGRREVSPGSSTEYSLSAYGKANERQSKTLRIEVTIPRVEEPPAIDWFITTAESVEPAASAELNWSTRNADRVILEPGMEAVRAAGQKIVRPVETTTYTLRAYGKLGDSQSESVKVEVLRRRPPTPADALEELWQKRMSQKIVKLIVSPQTDNSFGIADDGSLFFWGGSGQELWRSRAGVPLREVIFTAEGNHLITSDWNGLVRCYDQSSDVPVWKVWVPGVVSALDIGCWQGQEGIFVGTWRQGLFFCNTEGQLYTISQTDMTISAVSAFPTAEGCATGNWEGSVMTYTPDEEGCRRMLLRQPVQALTCIGSAGSVFALTARNNFYALDEKGEVFWLYECPTKVISWTFGSKANKCIYCTEGAHHYEFQLIGNGQRRLVEENALRGLDGERHDRLAADDEGDYLAVFKQDGSLTLHTGESYSELINVPVRVEQFYLDPGGYNLMVATDNAVYAYRNSHKLAHCRPSKLKINLTAHGSFVLNRSSIIEVQLKNEGERPATQVSGDLKSRFAQPITFSVPRVLPGQTISLRRDVVPEVAGAFTVSGQLSYLDNGESRTEDLEDLFTVEVKESA